MSGLLDDDVAVSYGPLRSSFDNSANYGPSSISAEPLSIGGYAPQKQQQRPMAGVDVDASRGFDSSGGPIIPGFIRGDPQTPVGIDASMITGTRSTPNTSTTAKSGGNAAGGAGELGNVGKGVPYSYLPSPP